MARWRWQIGTILLLAVGVPLVLPFLDLLTHPGAWRAWTESDRLLLLVRNTCLLVAGTLALALPAGIVGAVLLYRTDLPLRGGLRFLLILTLFIPLPLFASGWQAALGSDGWLPLKDWITPAVNAAGTATEGPIWKPWAQGIRAAVWVHAVAALPWVILLVGQGLCWVERELEEDARTAAGPWVVLGRVTLRRSSAAIGVAALWVALQTATEITVTDMMVVRTFAEEVYSQFVRPEPGTAAATPQQLLARAVAVATPQIVLACVLAAWAVRRWERTLPPLESRMALLPFRLGRWRWPALVGVLLSAGVLLGIPVASLVWKAGLGGTPHAWSPGTVCRAIARVLQAQRELVADSLLAAGLAGLVTALMALLCCWLALQAPRFRLLVLGIVIAAWAMPAPLLGLGLKATIDHLMEVEDLIAWPWGAARPLRAGLYSGPSLLPVLWAYGLRFLPFAVALLWPVVRLIPLELREAARVDGAGPLQELRYVIWPLTRGAWLRAALVVAVLSLGEVGASKLVATPGSHIFAHEVFTRMHFGVTPDLAALCLVVLLLAALGGMLVAIISLLLQQRHGEEVVE